MAGKLYTIRQAASSLRNGGNKAIRDLNIVLEQRGYHAILSLPKKYNKCIRVLDYPLLLFYCLFVFSKRDTILWIFHENILKVRMIHFFKCLKKYRIICFINDLNSIRFEGDHRKELERDLSAIETADTILAPNKQSCEMLEKMGIASAKIIPVGVWDYLHDGLLPEEQSKDDNPRVKVVFAGNLGKSPFIYDLGKCLLGNNLEFHLYGDGYTARSENCRIIYHGSAEPDELPELICRYDWGLVWDGDSINECHGSIGRYLMFNNPHKAGLYLASGLPIITWRKSGCYCFTKEHGCGIGVDSLLDIGSSFYSDDSYQKYKENVLKESNRIRRGYYINTALARAEMNENESWLTSR